VTWIVIVVVLLVAFGPVLWLVPSKRDRRLTALRGRARTEGLVVEIRHLPKLDWRPEDRVSAGGKVREPVIECAAYSLRFGRRLGHLPGWRVLRVATDGPPDPFPSWRYDQRPKGEGRRYLEQMLEPVRRTLAGLPDDVAGFEVNSTGLSVYWLERPGSHPDTVSELAAGLRALEAALGALEREIDAARASAMEADDAQGPEINDS